MWFVRVVAAVLLLWAVWLVIASWNTAGGLAGLLSVAYFVTALYQAAAAVFGAALLIALACIYDRMGDAQAHLTGESPQPSGPLGRYVAWLRGD